MNDDELPVLSAEVKKHRSKTWSLNQSRILKMRLSIGSEFSDESPYPSTPHDQLVWYPHPKHAWLLGKIVSETSTHYTILPIPSGTSKLFPSHHQHQQHTITHIHTQAHPIIRPRYEHSLEIKRVPSIPRTSTRRRMTI